MMMFGRYWEAAARWSDPELGEAAERTVEFLQRDLALDGGGALTYIAPNQANLRLVAERWPGIKFSETKEI